MNRWGTLFLTCLAFAIGLVCRAHAAGWSDDPQMQKWFPPAAAA